jgi:hypothetical protein
LVCFVSEIVSEQARAAMDWVALGGGRWAWIAFLTAPLPYCVIPREVAAIHAAFNKERLHGFCDYASLRAE